MSTENPLVYLGFTFGLSILPFALVGLTSFVKLNIVFSLLRNALGAGGLPSTTLCSTLALVLSLHIMAPVFSEVEHRISSDFEKLSRKNAEIDKAMTLRASMKILYKGVSPLEEFLIKHSDMRERQYFARSTEAPSCAKCRLPEESIVTLMPSFLLTEVREAVLIGCIVFLPFLVIDIVVASVLVGLGMMMVSPMTISLPLKLIVFVSCDGWFQLTKSLVLGYG